METRADSYSVPRRAARPALRQTARSGNESESARYRPRNRLVAAECDMAQQAKVLLMLRTMKVK